MKTEIYWPTTDVHFFNHKKKLNNKISHLCKTLAIPKSPNLTIPFFVKNMFYKIQKHIKYYTDEAVIARMSYALAIF